MQVDSGEIPPAIVATVEVTQAKYVLLGFMRAAADNSQFRLSKTRRKRPVPEEWVTADEISTFVPVDASEALYPGGKALSVDSSGEHALVGGSDGVAGVYSLSERRVLQALKGGGSPITDAVWIGSKAAIATSTGRVKIFDGQEEVASFDSHSGTVSAVAVHPSEDILASVGVDKSYVLYDTTALSVITQVYSDSGTNCSLLSIRHH